MSEQRKTTTLCTPADTDTGQSLSNMYNKDITDLIPEFNIDEDESCSTFQELQHIGDPNYLITTSMEELYQTVFEPLSPIIDGILYPGVSIIAGSSKIGKSFLVNQVGYHVSTGKDLWGLKVQQGTVLYLALEDTLQRIQHRIFRMFGTEDTPNFHFATIASKVGGGLEDQLRNFMRVHPDTKLIIIDTLQKIREISGPAFCYASDYDFIGQLKNLADYYGICILIVHHTRKQAAEDDFDSISGSNGISGCADCSMVMKKKNRNSLEAILKITGRDQADQVLHLVKDPERLVWNMDYIESENIDEPPDPILKPLAELFSDGRFEWQGRATDLITELKLNIQPNVFTKRLNVNAGKLNVDFKIHYENIHTRNGSKIILRRINEGK